MSKIIVIAPHPDDETIGCGGTLIKNKLSNNHLYWVIITCMDKASGYSEEKIAQRDEEIIQVSLHYGFEKVFQLRYPTAQLDAIPRAEIIGKIGEIFSEIEPSDIYLPYRNDIHSDHKVVFDSVLSCTKWFRYPSIKRILLYETLSETEFNIDPDTKGFRPNIFINISNYIDKKVDIMKIYSSEMGSFPFPRSEEAIRALAAYRGSTSGFKAAEAFMLLKEIIN